MGVGVSVGHYTMCYKYAFYSSKRIRPYNTRILPQPYIPYSTPLEGCAGCRVPGASQGPLLISARPMVQHLSTKLLQKCLAMNATMKLWHTSNTQLY